MVKRMKDRLVVGYVVFLAAVIALCIVSALRSGGIV